MNQTMTPTTTHSIGQQMDGPVDRALFSGVILRHATRELPGAGGLSALQHAMLTDPHPHQDRRDPCGDDLGASPASWP